mmetsp:Transcript_25953/g.86435  ORF Transcript_25953/g.86435 Transcript_25953/m.86435 type:complete len:261 (+) Transcript_25953:1764-2546(+)
MCGRPLSSGPHRCPGASWRWTPSSASHPPWRLAAAPGRRLRCRRRPPPPAAPAAGSPLGRLSGRAALACAGRPRSLRRVATRTRRQRCCRRRARGPSAGARRRSERRPGRRRRGPPTPDRAANAACQRSCACVVGSTDVESGAAPTGRKLMAYSCRREPVSLGNGLPATGAGAAATAHCLPPEAHQTPRGRMPSGSRPGIGSSWWPWCRWASFRPHRKAVRRGPCEVRFEPPRATACSACQTLCAKLCRAHPLPHSRSCL